MNQDNTSAFEQTINKVVKMHDDDLRVLDKVMTDNLEAMETNIAETKELLAELGYDVPESTEKQNILVSNDRTPIIVDKWETIAARAESRYPDIVSIEDVFTKEELNDNHVYMKGLQNQFKELNKLDKWDYTVAGIVGTIAALLDFFLVTKVNLVNKTATPGVLKSGVENLWNKVIPPDKVALLEKKYKVPFDISTNTSKISQEILGLNPRTHRFQSLGHDPILGFIFGIKDLLRGELTAIDGTGRIIIQKVSGVEGKRFIEAIITQFGHLLSDVNATSPTGMKLSIPAPLTPLLQLIQKGSVMYKDKTYTIGDLSKRMYYDGYNFNHFLGMSIPVVLLHVVIHLFMVLREMFSENYIRTKHKSDLLLFVANSILCAENVGKLIITENPFVINYVSWIDTAKYTVRVLKYVLVDYHLEQIDYIQKIIDQDFAETYKTIDNTWNKVFGDRQIVYL